MTETYFKWIDSPVGELLIAADRIAAGQETLTGLYLKGQKHFPSQGDRDRWINEPHTDLFTQVEQQLDEYFNHQRQSFDLPIQAKGTEFQQQVWQLLNDIPFGETVSYGSLAQKIGQPGASRAVGAANGRNPISIIVPCHRVISASGKLTGYAGGVDRKQWLLAHEQKSEETKSAQQISLFAYGTAIK